VTSHRTRISRETRLLLTAAFFALVALWILARVRFPDGPPTPNPVTPLMSQLALTPNFDDLAAEISSLQARLQSTLLVLNPPSLLSGARAGGRVPPVTALKVRSDLAIAVVAGTTSEGAISDGSPVLLQDPASGLTLIRLSNDLTAAAPVPWMPRRLQEARYLVASDVSSDRATLRPVFVGSLDPVEMPEWSKPVWLVPAHTALTSGTFVFSSNGELAGVVVSHGDRVAVVPAETLLADTERLLARIGQPVGDVGIRVQSLTAGLVAATGATEGVVVTWVNPDGAAWGKLQVADVIETVDGERVITSRHWDTRIGRLSAGQTVTLRLRRRGEALDQPVFAAPKAETPMNGSLGLTFRTVPRLGVEVLGVERFSAGERAGLMPGDVITMIGEAVAPTPSQVRALFASTREGMSVVVAFTRGDTHQVVSLSK
jgi:hypothetical protein